VVDQQSDYEVSCWSFCLLLSDAQLVATK